MLLAERAIFSDLHPLRMILLLFGKVVVPPFAFRARQRDSCTHNSYLAFLELSQKTAAYYRLPGFLRADSQKDPFFHTPDNYSTVLKGKSRHFVRQSK